MKKITMLLLMLAGLCYSRSGNAQQLVAWTDAPAAGPFGPQWSATATAANVVVTNFTKGAGIAGSGNSAGGSWGGSGGWSTTPAAATTNGSLYFTLKAADGYLLSLSDIPTFVTRRSASGPTGADVLYSLNGGASYTLIGSTSTTSTSGTGNNSPLSGLSAIADLQNIPSSTTVTIKVVPTNGANNWYIMYTGGGFVLNGTVSPAGPLPVTLRSFTANRSGDGALLAWETSFENNASHFELEKSTDAVNFTATGWVSASNAAEGYRYTYFDKTVAGKSYYRLKSVDKDEKYTYSKVIALNGTAGNMMEIALLQNPVRQQLSLNLPATAAYTILTLSGTLIQSGQISNSSLNVSGLGKGVYLLRLHMPEGKTTLKFVKE